LEVVYATGLPDDQYDDAINQDAESLLRGEIDRALKVAPELTVRGTLSRSTAGRAVTEASEDAVLVVVGSHPLGTMEEVFAGSLSYQIVAGAHCPVVVVPQGRGHHGSGVVVGADGSPDSVAAVAQAAAEADRLGQGLTVVHAWHAPMPYQSAAVLPGSYDERIEQTERVMLAESLAGLGQRYPDLVVHRTLVHDQPARALLHAAQEARLLVVGSRGLHGVARMLLGSVSHTVIIHAPCPVLVVRT
jgi:nucleotide-binding universal stress UspA family protein